MERTSSERSNTANLLTHLGGRHPDLYAKAWYGGKGKKADFQLLLALHRSICVCVCVVQVYHCRESSAKLAVADHHRAHLTPEIVDKLVL